MWLISRKSLIDFWKKHANAEQPLRAWFQEVQGASWKGPADIKAAYPWASILAGDRVVFNIGGNDYRLVVWVHYPGGRVLIKFVGTHAEYDQVDATAIGLPKK